LFHRSSTNFVFLFNDPSSPYELEMIKSARKSVILKIISRKTNVYNALMKLGEFQKIPGWCNIQVCSSTKTDKWPLYSRGH